MHWFYYVGRLIMWMLLLAFTRWHVIGKENVPRHGPLLVVANHINEADPPLLGVSIPRKMVFMAKEELFRSRLTGYFIGGFGAFPVRTGKVDRRALRRAKEVLQDNLALAIFPEGTRSHSGKMQAALPGSALIALSCGATILPVGITGTDKIKGLAWMFRRPRISVNIGQPFNLPSIEGREIKTLLTELTDLIMRRIAALLPSSYQGLYQLESIDQGS